MNRNSEIRLDARTARRLVRQALRTEIMLTPPEERRIELAFLELARRRSGALNGARI